MPTVVYHPTLKDGNGFPLLLGLKRSMLDIYQDLNALAPAQKAAVWAQFTAGSPPLWSTDDGPDSAALGAYVGDAIDRPVSAQWTAAMQLAARLRMVATYVRDNPLALVNPPFDPTIDVPGYGPP